MGRNSDLDKFKTRDFSIRRKLYNICSVITVISLSVALIETVITYDSNYYKLILAGALLLYVAITIITAKLKKTNFGTGATAFLIIFFYIPFSFFTGGGVCGDAPIWILYAILYVSVLMIGPIKKVFYGLIVIEMVVCYYVSFKYPERIQSYPDNVEHVYSLVSIVLIGIAIGIIVDYMVNLYQRQRIQSHSQMQEIKALSDSQNQFFSSMSHEIRTPINTIIGLNEMILRENISDEVAEDAANIRAAGKMLLSLINDILDMSKLESGQMVIADESYHPGDMLSDIVGMLWIRAKEKNLDFNITVAHDIPDELSGDEVRIKQILINVLNNAIKYTKEGSVSLTVQCEMKEDKTCKMIYMVSDTGIGIKSEDIPYLFSAFKRVDETATKHIEGTGLGLSIVKQLVDIMGGKITVNSVYKKGSTFIIEIPQRIEREGSVGKYDFAKAGSSGRKKEYLPKFEAPQARILVVDDNEANLMVVSKLLRDTKVRIDTATSGADALRKTLNIKYDVIFMDHLMPEMDGIECRRQIKDQTGGRCRDTAIVILTANADEENRALYARENFDGYLAKPVSGDALENELYNHLPKEIVHITGNRSEIAQESVSWMNGAKKRKSIVITTESVADLSPEIIAKYQIPILPHKVRTEEGLFKDGQEIETQGILKYMENPDHQVLPMGPSVREVEEFFSKQLTYANNVIHISISSKIEHSGYQPAIEASKSFDNVFVIDSAHLSSGQGLMALVACRMAEAGLTAEQIVKELEVIKKKIHTSFIVDNLDFLARANQVGNGTANIVKSVMGRPVLVLRKGKMGVGMTYFGTRETAWKAYINSVLTHGTNIDTRVLFVTYVGISKRETDWIREQIEKHMHFDEIYFKQASPAIAVSCGPGTFGLLYMGK
jgi:DegV family protein with EDD domain